MVSKREKRQAVIAMEDCEVALRDEVKAGKWEAEQKEPGFMISRL